MLIKYLGQNDIYLNSPICQIFIRYFSVRYIELIINWLRFLRGRKLIWHFIWKKGCVNAIRRLKFKESLTIYEWRT